MLSNNDGCIVALNTSAKALGLRRGQPSFKHQQTINKHGVQVFSSNYALYQEMSASMMHCLAEFSPRREEYSIDEAWLKVSELAIDDLTEFGHTIKERIYQHTGLPVRVALGSTKCLTKIACQLVKGDERYQGVLDLTTFSREQLDAALASVAVEEVWGIGAKYAQFLRNYGIESAKDLRDAEERWIRKYLTVVGARIQLELRGISCLPLEVKRPPKQQIICAKSFGHETSTLPELEEAVSCYVARTAEKLREQESLAARLTVFLRTNGFNADAPQYSNSFTIDLAHPTAFTPDLIKYAVTGLHAIYRPGFGFKKAGVVLSRITPLPVVQPDLFGEVSLFDHYRQAHLMAIVDAINRIFGRETVFFAVQGWTRNWRMRRERLSQRFTTQWEELLTI